MYQDLNTPLQGVEGHQLCASALLGLPAAAAAAPAALPVQEAQGKQPAREVAAAEPTGREQRGRKRVVGVGVGGQVG